jgi:hypothetical protein
MGYGKNKKTSELGRKWKTPAGDAGVSSLFHLYILMIAG